MVLKEGNKVSLALYRKYRSRSLSDIVGQDQVTNVLKQALKSGRIAHAYLFTGPRGVGKTSIARILAHEINKLPYTDDSSHLDIIEIDAASNNSVEDIRDLRDKVSLAPVNAKKKIYIIDEVHMLSKSAFNALLKTLEEPPEHVVFVLATTDVQKLPDTIISRTQRHNFKRATVDDLVKNLSKISKKEKIAIEPGALKLLAEHSDGSFRDSVSLLDQVINLKGEGEKITEKDVEQNLGLASHDIISKLLENTIHRQLTEVTATLKQLEDAGVQARVIASQLIELFRSNPAAYADHLSLLDSLLMVANSPLPSVKLLAILGGYAAQANKSAAQVASYERATVVAEAPIKELEKAATTPRPRIENVSADAPAQSASASRQRSSGTFDKDSFMKSAREKSVALASLLEKCGFEAKKGSLAIYARTTFYKKKLDTPKYQQLIHQALNTCGCHDWEITTYPTAKPSDNKHISAITAIMGGGEEVAVVE